MAKKYLFVQTINMMWWSWSRVAAFGARYPGLMHNWCKIIMASKNNILVFYYH
jgi:hypothetical protein